MHHNGKNLIGQTFGRLTVIEEVIGYDKIKHCTTWKCKCNCSENKYKFVITNHLTSGTVSSCGCLRTEANFIKGHKMSNSNIIQKPHVTLAKELFRQNYSDGNLNFNDFYEKSQMPCYYCGTTKSNKLDRRNKKNASKYWAETAYFEYNGLDRIDNNLPHNIDNIVTCCRYCNLARRNMNMKEFIEKVMKSYNYLLDKKIIQ